MLSALKMSGSRLVYDMTMIAVSALATALTLPNSLSWAWVMLGSSVFLQGGASSWNLFDGWRHAKKHDNAQLQMDRRLNAVVVELDAAQRGTGRVEVRLEAVEVKMDVKFEDVGKRFDKLETRFDTLETRFDKLDGKFDRLFEHLMMDPPADVSTKADVREAIDRSLVADHGFCDVENNRSSGQTLEDHVHERNAIDFEIRRRHAFGAAE